MPFAPLNLLLICTALVAFAATALLVLSRRQLAAARAKIADCANRSELAAHQLQAERSARAWSEESLRSSEGRTSAILDAAVDGIVTIDERGGIQSFNHAAERIFQYQAAEVVGRNIRVLMPEPYHSAHDQYLRNYLATGTARIIGIGREVTGQRKDGSTFPMDLAVGESVLDGHRIFAGIIRDISERKQTEDRLRESEEKFRLLVDGVRDYAITLLDTAGNISSWNQGAERLHGWAADDAVGRNYALFFTPDDIAAGEPERQLVIVKRDGNFEGKSRLMRRDGNRFWAHVTMSPLRDDLGRTRGYVRIARDMTEQDASEAALRQAKDEAERANLAKSKFLAAASHDLRQPVQALVFFTAALSMKIKEGPAVAMLGDLRQSMEGLNVLLESLLDVSKLDAGVVTAQFEVFPLSTILERISSEFTPTAAGKGIELRVVGCGEFTRSDPTLLGRVLRNLVANAVRYTPKGKVVIGVRHFGNRLRLEVWDSGIGIPADRLEEVFQEFTQLGNPERDRSQGLGLGLAIVRRLVRMLDHKLDVRSTPGRGSVFSITLPRAPRQVQRLRDIAALDAGHRLVVIIDDEATVLKGLGMILEEWGYEVLAAGSEDEAIDLLEERRRRPHAILADYRLRDGRTGAEAVRHIRALFNSPIPSIIITGDTSPERLREAEASGFSILHKPVQPPHLHSLLIQSVSGTMH